MENKRTIPDEEILKQQNNEENTKKRYITPIIEERWGKNPDHIIMEYYFTAGRITVDEYNMSHRGKPKKVDYLLLFKNNVLLALVEAKGRLHRADEGYSQAKQYARLLDVPFAYATNGDDLIEQDMISGLNKTMKISDFPTPEALWDRFVKEKGYTEEMVEASSLPYYLTSGGKKPRYYQRIAINRAVAAVAGNQKRILLVLATGTGKTFCSFQIIYRFWKNGLKKKILYLADRNILIDQTMRKDFRPFTEAMVKLDNKKQDFSKDIYLGLYHQLMTLDRNGREFYKSFPRDYFDLIVIDECHRGSASEDSNWHEILDWFESSTQIGMTATPKDGDLEEAILNEQNAKYDYEEAQDSGNVSLIKKTQKAYQRAITRREKAQKESNILYFGEPIYEYSLKQGIEDGFLAPYKVVSVNLDIDKFGYRPRPGDKDTDGELLDPNIVYEQKDFDRKIVIPERRHKVAQRLTEFMKTNDMRYAKTILFCEDIPHAEEMVRLLENENADLVAENPRYIVQITGDNDEGKKELDNFIDPYSKYPVIAVTSRLMSTGVDAETCEIVALDRSIGSMTEFKQIVGRGTRIKEHYDCEGEEKSKTYFTILDFRKNYLKFNDPDFDGEPVTVMNVPEGNPFPKPPVKPAPEPPVPPKPKAKVARVNGVNVEILGDDVQYLDIHGNLVTQNLSSCVKNNIIGQYETPEDFQKAWLLSKDKKKLADELLLDVDWKPNFKTRYGYDVDNYDIVLSMGYDMDPPMSKHQRIQTRPVVQFIEKQDDIIFQQIIRILLNTYLTSEFEDLKSVRETLGQTAITEMGLSAMAVLKKYFKNKQGYFKFLNELENKLYE